MLKINCPYCKKTFNYPEDIKDFELEDGFNDWRRREQCVWITVFCSGCGKPFTAKETYVLSSVENDI